MKPDTTQLSDGIAVIGMAGRFPGAPNLDVFWENLQQGVESITHFSLQELESPITAAPENFVPARGLVTDVDLFDAEFFGMQPREADYTDPQHRLLLETAWQALENAACDPARFPGAIGVFAGCSLNSYLLHNLSSNPEFLAEFLASQQMGAHPALLGNDKDFLATRISYKLNLRGPSVVVQSACSTSLVAVCQAAQALLTFQCDVALAGGVSVTFPQKRGYFYEEGAIVSKDGRCRPFDAAADGTVFGDGVGLVVLKRADEALRDGDPIRAIIRGFAVNNDGSGKVSYMAPSVEGQAEVIASAQAVAGVDVESIRYIESHGTGTSLGDPIEIAALSQAFGAHTTARGFCALGGLKGNVGHMEVAAGIGGLIKAILVLEQGEIPPTLNFSAPNPRIDFAATPFYVASKLSSWPESDVPRRAGVSSFGVGGTNAHVVLEQAPVARTKTDASSSEDQPQLLVLSARSESALATLATNLGEHLRAHPGLALADVAHTLRTGRRVFAHRRTVVASSAEEAAEALEKTSASSVKPTPVSAQRPGVCFLFPGQGAQAAGMCSDLYRHNALFRTQVDLACGLLRPELGSDLRELLFPAAAVSSEAQGRITQTALAQPALFVVEHALAQVWIARGVRPDAIIGHSLGEYVAAVLAGVFSMPDALHLLAVRGRLMQALPPGGMLAVGLPEAELVKIIDGRLSLASVNGPRNCVVSGPAVEVSGLREKLSAQGIACRELNTSHAFHSEMMEPMLAEFAAEVARVIRQPAQLRIFSTVHGREIKAEEWTAPSYWSDQLRQTVRFDAALAAAVAAGFAFLEVGPGQTLSSLARQNASRAPAQIVAHSCARNCRETDGTALLTATGQLWAAGVEIAWDQLHAGTKVKRVPLPTYPFERKRHWIERQQPAALAPAKSLEAAPQPPTTGNGATGSVATTSEIEALIAEQLRIMTRQIEVLRQPEPAGFGERKA